ncbi:hypothetical protein E5K00_18370 [Hymenobacter aquaticus]|uniref:Uncharacterized protein n=1 Tax=Hymenobacter aquaticus TaxID=1867101 RepID=A0A4Z0PZ90_9BACT|nr:hypothetical protein [Hymenobacter aquaticus]TGE22213.1 hypothetical protein E5K00_18370 [Hymenobacter aquaticus]
MTNQEEINHVRKQVRKGLLVASDSLLAFKRYKKTPVVIVRDGQVAEVSPDALPASAQKAA